MEITIISPLRFQHTAAEFGNVALVVLTHSRLKAAGYCPRCFLIAFYVSTHSRLKAAGYIVLGFKLTLDVSTHSRLKAAGGSVGIVNSGIPCFNTQPPKGGWVGNKCLEQSQAVSTHSRLKAAGDSE